MAEKLFRVNLLTQYLGSALLGADGEGRRRGFVRRSCAREPRAKPRNAEQFRHAAKLGQKCSLGKLTRANLVAIEGFHRAIAGKEAAIGFCDAAGHNPVEFLAPNRACVLGQIPGRDWCTLGRRRDFGDVCVAVGAERSRECLGGWIGYTSSCFHGGI